LGAKSLSAFQFDKRQFVRRSVSLKGTVFLPNPTTAQIIELSERGLMLQLKIKLPIASIVPICFVIPEGEIQVQGRVIYSVHSPDGSQGEQMGVRFTSIK
jgi:hypothetical protein